MLPPISVKKYPALTKGPDQEAGAEQGRSDIVDPGPVSRWQVGKVLPFSVAMTFPDLWPFFK